MAFVWVFSDAKNSIPVLFFFDFRSCLLHFPSPLLLFCFQRMPQAVLVLQCGNCQTYQGQLAKTATSWTCKICSQKQPLNNVLFQGTGKQCREKVQQLNMQRGIEETQRMRDAYQQDDNILRMKLDPERLGDLTPQHD